MQVRIISFSDMTKTNGNRTLYRGTPPKPHVPGKHRAVHLRMERKHEKETASYFKSAKAVCSMGSDTCVGEREECRTESAVLSAEEGCHLIVGRVKQLPRDGGSELEDVRYCGSKLRSGDYCVQVPANRERRGKLRWL